MLCLGFSLCWGPVTVFSPTWVGDSGVWHRVSLPRCSVGRGGSCSASSCGSRGLLPRVPPPTRFVFLGQPLLPLVPGFPVACGFLFLFLLPPFLLSVWRLLCGRSSSPTPGELGAVHGYLVCHVNVFLWSVPVLYYHEVAQG